MNPVMQEKKSHREDWNVVQTGIGENEPTSRCEKLAQPWLDSTCKLLDQEQPFF
jgi:hypothetical protein